MSPLTADGGMLPLRPKPGTNNDQRLCARNRKAHVSGGMFC